MKAVKVTLRERPKNNNQLSLYLDFYPPIYNAQGKLTRRKSLGIYLHKNPTDKEQRKSNNEKRLIAEQIRSQHEKQLLMMGAGLSNDENPKANSDFFEFFRNLMQSKRTSQYSNYYCVYNHLQKFAGDRLKCSEITKEFCNSFSDFLITGKKDGVKVLDLSVNTAVAYLNIFRTALFQAYKNDFLKEDVRMKMERVKTTSTDRAYLTMEEVKMLENTYFKNDLLRRASLFSIYTGLRHSDIRNLKWKNVREQDGTIWLNIQSQKTGNFDNIPIHSKAVEFMGTRGQENDFVFPKLIYGDYYNALIRNWVLASGIKKTITFHSFRHSYATILLNQGVNIEVVSALLGHRRIATTQIYAKIVGKSKEDAVKKITFD